MKRNGLFWVCVILFFPLSILLFLIPEQNTQNKTSVITRRH
jgi:hypothetical protein